MKRFFQRLCKATKNSTTAKRRPHQARLAVEALESRLVPSGTYFVTNTNDSGTGSLRDAILWADATPTTSNGIFFGPNLIDFHIGTGAHKIAPKSLLPAITNDWTYILGATQPGYAGKPLIELSGQNLVNSPNPLAQLINRDGLDVKASDCEVQGLVINRFQHSEIDLEGGYGNVIVGNYLGTDSSGTKALPYATGSSGGVTVWNSSNNRIGGTTAQDRNIISGNIGGIGVELAGSNNVVEGNYIGTDVSGTHFITANVPTDGSPYQALGVFVHGGSNNQIGGILPGSGNLISGNRSGVEIVGFYAEQTNNNLVANNRIGTDVTGTQALGNVNEGVIVSGNATDNFIGGPVIYHNHQFYSQGNQISGNGDSGVTINDGATGTQVQGNKIGTDYSGTKTLGNGGDGVLISNASHNLIGGQGLGAGNVIAANGQNGLEIFGGFGSAFSPAPPAIGNQVECNWIGTDPSGTRRLGNHLDGVFLHSDPAATSNSYGNEIGDSAPWLNGGYWGAVTPGLGNVIAFNGKNGVDEQGIHMFNDPIRGNDIYGNGGLGINTYYGRPAPLLYFAASGSTTIVSGYLPDSQYETLDVDFYATSSNGTQRYLGTLVLTTWGYQSGLTTFTAALAPTSPGEVITATTTNYYGGTSEFSAGIRV